MGRLYPLAQPTEPDRAQREWSGGGSGIRTHEGAFAPYPLSRRAHSATMRSLRWLDLIIFRFGHAH